MVGRCDVAVDYLIQIVGGTRRDGVWTGPTHNIWGLRGRWRKDAKGHPVHAWIEQPDGTIVDPARWVFEGCWPYFYRGPADFYAKATFPIEPEVDYGAENN